MKTTITLAPISKRGKDRINSHGATFTLIDSKFNVQTDSHRILVESLGNTWRGEKWLGWFITGQEVKIVLDNEPTSQ